MRFAAVRALASTMLLRGDLCGALEHASACWTTYDIDTHGPLGKMLGHDPGVAAGVYRAWALWLTGAPDQAMAQAIANTELAQRLRDPSALAYSRSYAAMIAILWGDLDRADALASAAEEMAEAREMVLFRAIARTQRGWARSCRGDTASGLPLLREGTEAWRATGAAVGGSLLYAALAEGYLAAGDLAGAQRSLEAAESITATTGEQFHTPEILRLRARLARCRGSQTQVAEQTLAGALAMARAQGALSWELRIATELADLRAEAGDRTAARELLAPTLERLREGYETRDQVVARALLARVC
jgi:ATP/maltotriose-dependent transcriptional regulator MalT